MIKSFYFYIKQFVKYLDGVRNYSPKTLISYETDLKQFAEFLKVFFETDEDIKIGQLLIAAGADINSRNLDGQTPEDMAKDFASKSMLMNASLEAELPLNETQQNQVSQPTTTKSKKMKI